MKTNIAWNDPAKPFLIADIGSNHCGDLLKAKRLVEAAAVAGVHAVKFQSFTHDDMAAPGVLAPDSAHETLQEFFAHGGLPLEWHRILSDHARQHGLSFLSTPGSVQIARYLVEVIKVPALKIASGDLTYTPLLEYANSLTIPVLLSTGASHLEEIAYTVHNHLRDIYARRLLVIMHCRSVYPADMQAMNVKSIRVLQDTFPELLAVGLSDHSLSVSIVQCLALACGATVFEKHLKLGGVDDTPDAGHSLTPDEFADMTAALKVAANILGQGTKEPLEEEGHDRQWARRDPSDWLRPLAAVRKYRS